MAGLMLGLGAIGTAIQAIGTIASGNAAAAAGDYQAKVLHQNAMAETAAGQRRAIEDRKRGDMLQSTLVARAAKSGLNPSVGSPLNVAGDIAKESEYHALMSMWEGQNRATGLENQATAARYEGQLKKDLAPYSAIGTLASGFGSMYEKYKRYGYG